MKFILLQLIKFYQKTISPDHGWLSQWFPWGYCRYYPSCSEYTKQAINKRGLMKGGVLAVYRLVRCNPWSRGGVDEA